MNTLPLIKKFQNSILFSKKRIVGIISQAKFPFCVEKNIREHQQQKQLLSLSELPFEELLKQGSQQAMLIAQKRLVDLEQYLVDLQKLSNYMHREQQFFKEHAEQLNKKQEILMENLKAQNQELQLIQNRTQKQIHQTKDFSVCKIAQEIIQIADSLKMCDNLANQIYATTKYDLYALKIKQSKVKLLEILSHFDIEELDPTGQHFDPNTQESLLQIPCPPGQTINKVATTMRTGYKIKGRLLRSATVGIFS